MAYHHPVPGPGSGSGSSSSSGLHFLNLPFGDTTFTKVFVGGLAWETQSETLRRHFEQYGEILEAVVISDKNTGRSKGYGFVSVLDFGVSKSLDLYVWLGSWLCWMSLHRFMWLNVDLYGGGLGDFSWSRVCKESVCWSEPHYRWETGEL